MSDREGRAIFEEKFSMAGSIYRCIEYWENEASFWSCVWLSFAIVVISATTCGRSYSCEQTRSTTADVGSRRLQIYGVADI